MMRLQGKRVSYHDITDFVPGHVVEKERETVLLFDREYWQPQAAVGKKLVYL